MSTSTIRTLSELFLEVASRDQQECLLYKQEGRYEPISSAELTDRVKRLHEALYRSGIRPGDRIALMAENGPHWPVIDFAVLTLGAVLTPIYPTLTDDQAAFIIGDCGARIVFVQGVERLYELKALAETMPAVERYVSIGESEGSGRLQTLDQMLVDSEPDEEGFARRAGAVGADDLATLIYTSGTTGRPKGVMLSHANITSNILAALEVMDFRDDYTALSFLPLSHSFERTVDYCYFALGITIAYAESVREVPKNMMEVRPHVFVSVPRVYEKILAKVQEGVARSSPVKRALFNWAVGVGRQALPHRLAAKPPGGLLGLKLRLADKLVFSKIKARLGGRFEFAISGGAPMPPEVARFFWGAGIRIFEGYGLSETSPVLTANRPDSVRLGTVGAAIPGVELRIADDGEILARGPNVMVGYYGLPETTAEAIDSEGWFLTGDIGEFDEAWHLKITDRKKEIIVNAYGKNIAPAPIESALKASPYVGHAVVIGDRRKFLSALLVPDFDTLGAWCEQHGIPTDDWESALANEKIRNLFAYEVAQLNEELSSYQRIRAWSLLSEDFSVEAGELTPTQKVKRRVVVEKHGPLLDRLYADAEKRGASKGAPS